MTAVAMPTRRWGDEPKAEVPRPVVIVSSRDGFEVPHVAGVARLAKLAEAAGWTVRLTYAYAEVPATARRAAHGLASVAVRLARGAVRGFAVWHRIGEGAWKFDCAVLGLRRLGARALTTALSAP